MAHKHSSPYLEHLGVVVEAHDILSFTADERHANTGGKVHGGMLASILDSALGHAVAHSLPADKATVTVSLTTTFLEPGEIGDELRASASIIRRGNTIATVEGDVIRVADGVKIAHALGSFAIIDRENPMKKK